MNDVKTFLDAVLELRAAQKLEMNALPDNLNIWKRARPQQNVAQLKDKVDAKAQELLRIAREGQSQDRDESRETRGSE